MTVRQTAAPVFRFDEAEHAYFLDDVRIPSVTQLIERGGLLGEAARYYTEASRDRGHEVHRLTAQYDLTGYAPVDGPCGGYVKGYIDAMKALSPDWTDIEVAAYHAGYRFAGRPDRVGPVFRVPTVLEIKSAAKAKHHPIQTALQALLVSPEPRSMQRMTLYLKDSARWCLDEHTDGRDFDTALRLIQEWCR